MNFKEFVQEKEDSELDAKASELIDKVKDFIKDTDVVSDDLLHAFAEELGMESGAVEEIIYKLLKDYIASDGGDEEEVEGDEEISDDELPLEAVEEETVEEEAEEAVEESKEDETKED